MLINDRYKIESDSLNVTLYQKGISKPNGNVYWRPIAYFNARPYLIGFPKRNYLRVNSYCANIHNLT